MIKIDQPTRSKLGYLNKETQKLVPSRNFGHLEPQKFVPASHKKSAIRKIKLPKNFHAIVKTVLNGHPWGMAN